MTAETDIDKLIYKYFDPAEDRVSQAMKYCLDSGGKRVRPSLLLETALQSGMRRRQYLSVGCCVGVYSHLFAGA